MVSLIESTTRYRVWTHTLGGLVGPSISPEKTRAMVKDGRNRLQNSLNL